MAEFNINDGGTIRFEYGGKLIISNGTDTFTVITIESGSVSWRDGRHAIQRDVDRGVLLQGRIGEQQHSVIEFAIKTATLYGANSLAALASHAGITDGAVPEYTVAVERYTDASQTTGESYTWANTDFDNGMNVQTGGAGAERDMGRFTMMSRTTEAVYAAISA